jgi:DNA-binding transcriptional LysR family regulator
MWTSVELREIRVFLTLAEELHFGRTAERLGITRSRVSQTISTLEVRVGGKLFDRTSRQVKLTSLGQRLRASAEPPYRELQRAFEDTRATTAGVAGTLRIGMLSPVLGGPHMVEIVKAFQSQHPNCEVAFTDTGMVRGQFDWLRSDEVALLAMRLPILESDVTIGPILSSDERVVAVANDHPLAGRESISYEEIADYPVTYAPALPREMMDAFIPPRTPSGRLLRRVEIATIAEAVMLAAAGDIVHPTVRSFLQHGRHPGITAVPVRDLPASETALVWLTANHDDRLDAFVRTAQDILRAHDPLTTPKPTEADTDSA